MMKKKTVSCAYLLAALTCAQMDLKASHIEDQFQDANQSKNNNTATVVDDWNRIPDTVIRDHLLPALRVGDYHVMRQVSKHYNQTLKSLLSKDESWRHAAARHYPAPFVALLQEQSQCRAAVKLMLLSEPRVDFYQFPDAPYTYITAISWDGSIVAGKKQSESGHMEDLWISTPQTGIQALPTVIKTIPIVRESKHNSIVGMNWNGSMVFGAINEAMNDILPCQAFIWKRDTGMQLLDLLPESNVANVSGVNWDGTIVSGINKNIGIDQDNRMIPNGYEEYKSFIWTPETGTQSLQSYMPPSERNAQYAVNRDKSIRNQIQTMSKNGLTVAGYTITDRGINNVAFIYKIGGDLTILSSIPDGYIRLWATNWDGSKLFGNQIKKIDGFISYQGFMWSKQGIKSLYNFGKSVRAHDTILSEDGQILIAKLHPEKRASIRPVLHNFATGKTLDIKKLLAPYWHQQLPEGYKFDISLFNAQTNVIGNLFVSHTSKKGLYKSWRAIIPRYDIVKAEGMACNEPEYLAAKSFEYK